jgi:hypothetical protein
MSGLTESNHPVVCVCVCVCVCERSPAQGMLGKEQYAIDTDMLQLQVG